MPSDKSKLGRGWRRFLSNHNPLYLFSAWLVLHGLGIAFKGETGLNWMPLMTPLLCTYILALACSGWLVIRAGKLWEDARMILLVVLLMFTALSTSYDDLCLKDPATGAIHLAIGYAFCCAVTEMVLYLLGIRLPMRYRAPFYFQLAILFAFPAWLGKCSVEGHDPAMCLGVLAFPVAAGGALLTLLPAARGSAERDRVNGTPWPWPFFPWSIFVFVAIASGIRAWMLSLSFTPAWGVEPAFLPYFLCPIVLAMLVLALELGLRHRSRVTQWIALLGMLAGVWIACPGVQLNSAQLRTLDLLEKSLAGPPLLVCVTVAAIAVYAMIRRAAGAELVAVVSLTLLTCLDTTTRSLEGLHTPQGLALLILVGWQLGHGLWTRSTPRMAFGGVALLIAAGHGLDTEWLIADRSSVVLQLAIVWCALLPLYCSDGYAEWFRAVGPALLGIVATLIVFLGPGIWRSTPLWVLASSSSALAAVCLLYWVVLRLRWFVPTVGWVAALSAMLWLACGYDTLSDMQFKHGLAWYVAGCLMLGAALAASMWKAGVVRRLWTWLQYDKLEGELANGH